MSDAAIDPRTGQHELVSGHGPGEDPHPGETHFGDLQYVYVAICLAAITGVEVALSYTHFAKLVLVIALCALAMVKFGIVAAFFMHLRFDSPVFRRLFMVGIVLAIFVYTIVLLTFGVLINNRDIHDTGRSPGSGPSVQQGQN
jgi:cytochrome c oxidase subunit 4